MTNGFLINSKICPNIFKEAKKLFTKEYIDKFYQKYPELLAAAISIENVLIGKKFNALYNGNHSFKLEIKKNDLINNLISVLMYDDWSNILFFLSPSFPSP